MNTAQKPQFFILCRLQADTEPVYAGFFILAEGFGSSRRPRIQFHRYLGIAADMKSFSHMLQQFTDFFRRNHIRRTAADKNSFRPAVRKTLPSAFDFGKKSLHIPFFYLFGSRGGQEITIITFFHTKGNVNIKT